MFRAATMKKADEKSEWWVVDGEMHEIGENVPPRERFVIPRDNLPNKRRKQMREQFMRRTRLLLKEPVSQVLEETDKVIPRKRLAKYRTSLKGKKNVRESICPHEQRNWSSIL